MAAALGLLAAGSVISALISSIASFVGNQTNVASQQFINEQNVQAQKDINEQNIEFSKEFAQNGIQWRVQDLESAGLNPVLAAGQSGQSSPTAMSAPVQKAPFVDFSGIGSAVTAMSNMMLTGYLMEQRNDVASERNDVLRDLYKRKAEYFDTAKGSQVVGNAKQISKALADNPDWEKEWDKLMKEIKNFK